MLRIIPLKPYVAVDVLLGYIQVAYECFSSMFYKGKYLMESLDIIWDLSQRLRKCIAVIRALEYVVDIHDIRDMKRIADLDVMLSLITDNVRTALKKLREDRFHRYEADLGIWMTWTGDVFPEDE